VVLIMVAETKGTRMNTKALAVAASLWVPMVATAATEASVTDRQEALSAQLESILSKSGISIGGNFRGEVGASILGGNSANPKTRDDESIGFTSIDFDLRARPNTVTTARAVFRMHLDHSAFFGSPYAPFETRWLSLDGGAADMLYYHFGSLNEKWTKLSVGSTIPGFLYTPRLFKQQQQQAMAERFITEGRNLQGVSTGLRAAVPAASIDSFNVSLLAAKLLSAGPIGFPISAQVSGMGISGDGTSGYPDSLANFDRWALGAKGSVTFLKGISLGANVLQTMDLRSTFGTTDTGKPTTVRRFTRPGLSDSIVISGGNSTITKRDTIIQNGMVIAGNLGANGSSLLGNSNLIADLDVDFATSSWKYYSEPVIGNPVVTVDSTGTTTKRYGTKSIGSWETPIYASKSGMAVVAGVTGGWKTESWVAKIKLGYMMNDSLFRSDLAQAPVFDARFGRIYNSEQDLLNGTGITHYNTFDALYHSVHRWVAEEKNEYAKNPYDKLAYSNYVGGQIPVGLGKWTSAVASASKAKKAIEDTITAINGRNKSAVGDTAKLINFTKSLATSASTLYATALSNYAWDRDLQLVLPAGEASANRVGPKFGLDFDLMQGGVEVKVDGYMLTEAKGSVLDSVNQAAAEKAKFQQIQAGARVRADKFISGYTMPIELTGSIGLSSAKGGASLDYASTVINAGLYAGVMKRLAVLGGYQAITGKDKATFVDRNQSNVGAGLEFKVQEGAYLLGMYNLIKTEFPNASQYNFDQTLWSTKISVSF